MLNGEMMEIDYKKIVEEMQLIYGQDKLSVMGQKIQLQSVINEYKQDPKFQKSDKWVKLSDRVPKKIPNEIRNLNTIYLLYDLKNDILKQYNYPSIFHVIETYKRVLENKKNYYWQKIDLPEGE